MLRVLLADDEPFILLGLRAMIDWEAEGFCIAGTVENGRQALEFLKGNPVDLIIADIRMPEMDGLELLKEIRDRNLTDARFVFLSGIGDFSCAQKAIRLRCAEYILKPVQKSDLIGLLRTTRAALQKDKAARLENARMEDAFYARSMVALLTGKYDSADLTAVRKRLGEMDGCRYIGMETGGAEADGRAVQRKLYRACLDFIGEGGNRFCIFNVTQRKGCYDVGILYCGPLRGLRGMDEHTFLERLRLYVSDAVQARILYYAGCRVQNLTQLSESYRTANIARVFQTFTPDRDIVWYEEKMKSGLGSASLDKALLDTLIRAVADNDKPRIESCVRSLYDQIGRMELNEDLIGLDINYIIYQLLHLAARQDSDVNQGEVLRYINENAFGREVKSGSETRFLNFMLEYADYLASLRNRSAKGDLAEIEREIERDYAQNLSLKALSEKHYLNAAYLGQLFKKKFGMSFKNYLTNYRIEKAAQRLLQTDEKIYAVAADVGYRDIDYFINRFVEVKGCTPAKFRRRARGDP